MKYCGAIVFALFLLAFAATSYASSSTWGSINKKDKILLSERIYNYTSPYGVRRNVQFPKLGKANKVKITAIQVLDYSRNATASYCSLIAGGPRFTYTTLTCISQPRNGLDLQLVIYGK